MASLRHPNVLSFLGLCLQVGAGKGPAVGLGPCQGACTAAGGSTGRSHGAPCSPTAPAAPDTLNLRCLLPPPLQPPCLVSEYCPRGSLFDTLKEARTSAKLARELSWLKRLRMVSGFACVSARARVCVFELGAGALPVSLGIRGSWPGGSRP